MSSMGIEPKFLWRQCLRKHSGTTVKYHKELSENDCLKYDRYLLKELGNTYIIIADIIKKNYLRASVMHNKNQSLKNLIKKLAQTALV